MANTRASARPGLRLLPAQILVALGIVMTLTAGLAVVVGPNGLQWVHYDPRWPVVGDNALPMSAEAVLNDDAGVVVQNTPVWENTSGGARDVATGGPPLEVTGPFTAHVRFMAPTSGARWAWVAWRAAEPLLVTACLMVVLRLVRSARSGSPFTRVNARRLQLLALLVGVGGTLLSATGALVRQRLLDTSAAASIVERHWSIAFAPLLAGVLIWVIAEVWRSGITMADDLEGVV